MLKLVFFSLVLVRASSDVALQSSSTDGEVTTSEALHKITTTPDLSILSTSTSVRSTQAGPTSPDIWYETTSFPILSTQSYNYLDLMLQWREGACYKNNACSCTHDTSSDWKIHGLWPSQDYTDWPENCDGNECTFDVGKLNETLRKELEVKWPTFMKGKGSSDFWKHEYCKHATCCKDILPTAEDYFTKTINLSDTADLARKLASSNITASAMKKNKTYNLTEFQKVLKTSFSVDEARYFCRHVDGKQLLYQIGLCVSKSFEIVDCPGGQYKHGCNESLPVYYLSSSVGVVGNSLLVFFMVLMSILI